MINQMSKRPYKQTQRADQQEQTRERIVRATMELHGEIGPRNTTIKAIAERAGVQRLTVYRHFDNEDSLFLACSGLWLSLNPPPQPEAWADQPLPHRLRTALTLFYRYYSDTRQMWHGVYRDLDEVPSLRVAMTEFGGFMEGIYRSLLADDAGKATAVPLRQTLIHALQFSTWISLEEQGMPQTDKVELVMAWLSPWLAVTGATGKPGKA